MGDHDNPVTCLSSPWKDRPGHANNIRDEVLHYFGCLGDEERKGYFNGLPDHKKKRIEKEERRILEQRHLFENDPKLKDLVASLNESMRLHPLFQNREMIRAPIELIEGYEKPCKENGFGMSAYAIFKKKSEFYDDKRCTDTFPDQRISIKDLLYKKDKNTNPLMRDCEEDEIRYFHIPSNNMEWVEEAIARHYNEERPEYEGLFRRPEKPSKSYMALRPEFWRGQQHGGRHGNVHARHMRHRCDVFSTDLHPSSSKKNLVLFMPYLHWEIDRRRVRFDEVMRKITDHHEHEVAKKNLSQRPRTQDSNAQGKTVTRFTVDVSAQPSVAHRETNGSAPDGHKFYKSFSETAEAMLASKLARTSVAKQLARGTIIPTKPLGQILLRAAHLYEAMSHYHEEVLLKEFLHHDPPFHPRRTLHQSHYWTLRTTKKLDREQVVYRGTAPKTEFRHSGFDCVGGCLQCRVDIRKVPRVIMVDQLWLWILDGNTIITSFPKRYGRNKPDPDSSVHKRIRDKLRSCRPNEIRSAYDLGLIIIDECSRVLLNSTKTADRQPKVMDLFANEIAYINNRQSIAYGHFWDTTREAAKLFSSKFPVKYAEDKSKSLLDINTEGKLLRQVKDISNEILIMVEIKKKQKTVLEQFKKHVEAISSYKPNHAGHAKHTSLIHDAESEDTEASKKNKAMEITTHKDGDWGTLDFATEILKSLEERIADLGNLRVSAEYAEKALDVLLSLKQQQAGVVQAQKAVQQTEETLRQGTAIMLFTVVTIIFLPLGFMASIFGMNAVEINNGLWTLKQEFIYMFPISLVVIAVSFILAFSTLTRDILSFLFSFVFDFLALTWMRFIIATRLYSVWLSLKSDNQDMRIRRRKKIRQWKEVARTEKQKRKEERQREAEKKEKKRLEMELEMELEEKLKKPNQVLRNGNVVRSRTSQMEKGIEVRSSAAGISNGT